MTALVCCRCAEGRYTVNGLKYLGKSDKTRVVAQVGEDLTFYETTTTYMFEAKCLLCGRIVKFKAFDEETVDMVLDLIIPYSMHWILPENIELSPRKQLA